MNPNISFSQASIFLSTNAVANYTGVYIFSYCTFKKLKKGSSTEIYKITD